MSLLLLLLFRLWTYKCCVLIGILIGSSYIPQDYLHIFNQISDYSSLTGGFSFVVLQLILIHEFVIVFVKPWFQQLEGPVGSKVW